MLRRSLAAIPCRAGVRSRRTRLPRTLAVGLIAACAIGSGGSLHAQSIVTRSTGPSASQFPPGKRLPANARIRLAERDRLSLLDPQGTVVLSGPGDFVLNGKLGRHTSAWDRLRGVLSAESADRRRPGGVRGPLGSPPSPTGPGTVWFLDTDRPGTYCIAERTPITLWRSDVSRPSSGTLSSAVERKTYPVAFVAGESVVAWPEQLAVVAGGTYTFRRDDTGAVLTARVVRADGAPFELADALASQGCSTQFALLAKEAAPADGASASPP
jgi:hypothetical protein